MRNHILSAHLALALAVLAAPACGGTATEETITDDTGAETIEAITAEEADLEADADIKADRASLTSSQQTIVLKAIDDTCGDTWCEGEFNYEFKRLACDFGAKRCTLSANVVTYDTPAKKYPRACRMTGITGFSAMVTKVGTYYDLKQPFFDKVSTCIDKWGPTIPQ
jgi:hypothetical protein